MESVLKSKNITHILHGGFEANR